MKFLSRFRLLEAKDPEGKDWDVVVAEEGLGSNNRFYSAEILKKASPFYQHVPVFLFKRGETADHLSDELADEQFRLVGNQVGFLEDPRFAEFKADSQTKKGILARLHIDDGAKSLRAKLLDWWNHGVMDKLGLSHNAAGPHPKNPVTGIEEVEAITAVDSVELVSFPAQGGQFLRLLASQGGTKMFEKLEQAIFAILKKLDADLVEGIDEENITDDQVLEMLEAGVENENFYTEAKALEAKGPFMQTVIARVIKLLQGDKKDQAIKVLTQLQTKMTKYGYPSPAKASDPSSTQDQFDWKDLFPEGDDIDESKYTDCMKREMKAGKSMADAAKICKIEAKKESTGTGDGGNGDDPNKAALDRIAKVEEDIKKSQSAAILEEVLGQSDLFQPVKDKIRAQFKDRIFEKKDLEESLKAEKAVLAKLSESGNVRGLGQTKVEVTLAEADKHQIAMDLLLDVEVKDKKGVGPFRGLKEAYRTFNPKDPDVTFQQPRNIRITEALQTGDFAYALGVSITRKFVKIYKLLDLPWREFVNIVPIDDFKEQERIRWGGFGELPTVLQDGTYLDIAHPTDEEATYSALKKGGLFAITRETIKNDDMNMLRQVPTRLARAAARTLSAFVWAFLKDNPTIYDGATLFNAARGNLGSAALSYDSLGDARTAMKSMRERGNKAYAGTADADSSVSVLEDDDAEWDAGADLTGYHVRIIYGTGVGQIRKIASNTATSITVDTDFVTAPDVTSKYEVSQYTDEKVGLKPAYLAFPTELEAIAEAILTSEYIPFVAERTRNVLKNMAKPLTPPQLTDPNDWYLIADKAWIDMLEIGFIDGKEDPTVLVQDAPGVGAVFTRDRITYKVRHEYGGAVIDYRGFYKAVVA